MSTEGWERGEERRNYIESQVPPCKKDEMIKSLSLPFDDQWNSMRRKTLAREPGGDKIETR